MNRIPILIFAWIAFASLGPASEPVRLAISSDPAFVNEADLISVELSKSKEIILLERQQILKIAEEHSLLSGKAGDDLKLGHLLGADGLLILSSTEVDGRKLLSARLVAVRLGVVIDEWISPPHEADEGRGMPLFFSHRIEPLLQKLRVAKEDVIPVSVAGLFSAVDSPELRSVERELTWLLIHRLTREPSVIVLERRRMEDLVLEKNLADAKNIPFLSGAVIVEGKLEAHDGKLDLALGLRRPGEKKAKPSSVTGEAKDLPVFAEKIAASILDGLKLKSTEGSWNIEEEAALYQDQAEWALHHRMIELCITSAESAWALGRRDVDLARMRVIAHSLIATPYWPEIVGDSIPRGGFNVGYNDWKLMSKDPTRDLAAAIRALEISSECLSADLPPSRITGRRFRPVAAQALLHASQLIKKHYLSGKYQEHAEQLTYLRSLAINVATILSNTPEIRPPHYEMSYRKDSLTLQSIATYAPYWHDNNEEIVAWYQRLFKSVPLGESNDDALMDSYNLESYRSYENVPARLVPWVVAWNPAENRQRQLDMITRLKRLTESSDFDDQLVGWTSLRWLVEQAQVGTRTENDLRWPQDYAEVLAGKNTNESPHHIVSKGIQYFLWNFRDKLATSHKAVAAHILKGAIPETDRDYRIRYARYIFESGHLNHWLWLGSLLEDINLSEAESIEFHQACALMREKAQMIEDIYDREGSLACLNDVGKILVKSNPQLKSKPKPQTNPKPTPDTAKNQTQPSPPFIVTRYWYPSSNDDAPKLRSGFGFPTNNRSRISVTYANGKLWFVKANFSTVSYLGSVALDSFDTDYHEIPITEIWGLNESPVVTKDAFYLLDMKGNMKFDLHDRKWTSLPLPSYPYNGRLLGDTIFLQYEFGSELRGIDLKRRASAGSGIVRLDPSNDSFAFLASSRRRPAETILDAREPYMPKALYAGADGAVSVALEFLTSGDRKILRMTPAGDWEEVIKLPNEQVSQINYQYVNDGLLALVHTRGDPAAFFQTVFFGADAGAAEILLSISKPTDRPDAILPGAPRWDLPPGSNHNQFWNTAYDYYDGRLYQMRMLEDIYDRNYKKNADTPTPEVKLNVYIAGKKLPVTIPLKFQLSDADKNQIIAHKPNSIHLNDDVIRSGPMADSLAIKNVERVSGMKVVPEGIVFFGGDGIGFWLLTKKELEERIEQSRMKQEE